MRKITIAITMLFFLNGQSVYAAVIPAASSSVIAIQPPANDEAIIKFICSLKPKQIEKMTGKKMTLKQRIGLKVLKWKYEKGFYTKYEKKSKHGSTAMILGIIAVGILFIPYLAIASIPCAILAIIYGSKAKKENPDDGQAKAGFVLGIVALGLIALSIILLVAILASWGW